MACGPFPLLRWLTRRIHVTGPRAPASARTRLWRVCKVDAGTVAQLPSPGRGRASRGGGESPPRCPEAWTPEGPPQTQGDSATRHPPCTTHARWHDCLSGEPNTPPARPRTRGGVCTRGPLRPPGVVDVGPPSAPGSQIQGRNPVFGAPGPVHSLPRRQPSRRARRHVRRAALGKMFCPPGFLSPRTNWRAGSGRPGWARAGLSVPRPHTGQPRGLVSCVRLSRLHPEEGDGGCAQAARRGAPGDAAATVAGTESETRTVRQPGRPAGVGATLTSPVTLQGLCSPTTRTCMARGPRPGCAVCCGALAVPSRGPRRRLLLRTPSMARGGSRAVQLRAHPASHGRGTAHSRSTGSRSATATARALVQGGRGPVSAASGRPCVEGTWQQEQNHTGFMRKGELRSVPALVWGKRRKFMSLGICFDLYVHPRGLDRNRTRTLSSPL